MPAKNGAATNASTTMRARMVSPLARRAEGGALRPQRVCLSIGEPGGRTTRTTPLLLGTLKVALRGGGKLCGSSRGSGRSIATTNCNVRSTVSRARNTASTRLAALSRHENVSGSYTRRKLHEEGPGEDSPGPLGALLVLRPRLRGEIPEPDEAGAATVRDGDRPAETGRACRPARRERLVPTSLHRLADRVRARRQTREQVVARGVGHCGGTDRAADLNAPALETRPRRCINEHLAIERRGPAGRAGVHAACGRGHHRRFHQGRLSGCRIALVDGRARALCCTHRAVRSVVPHTAVRFHLFGDAR